MARLATHALGLIAAVALPQPDGHAMSGYLWKKRPLVVFAPGNGNASLSQQRDIVAQNRGGFAARDIVIVYVVGDSVSSDLRGGPGLSADVLRKRYGVASGAFRAVLVGKDGGAKLSSGAPLASSTLFGTIDAMPMRQDEIRKRGG
jgi:Domain of unknown function (DUF4174)